MKWWQWALLAGAAGGVSYAAYRVLNPEPDDEEEGDEEESDEEEGDESLTKEQREVRKGDDDEEVFAEGIALTRGTQLPGYNQWYIPTTPESQELDRLQEKSDEALEVLMGGWPGLAELARFLRENDKYFILDTGDEGNRPYPSESGYFESKYEKQLLSEGAAARLHPAMFVRPNQPLLSSNGPAIGDEGKVHVSPTTGQWFIWVVRGDSWSLEPVPVSVTGGAFKGLVFVDGPADEARVLAERAEWLKEHPTGMYYEPGGRILKLMYQQWYPPGDVQASSKGMKESYLYPAAPSRSFRKKIKTFFPVS